MNQFERPIRGIHPEPSRIVGRRAIRPGNPLDREFDDFFKEAQQMQRAMIKSTPWYFKAWAVFCALFAVTVSCAVLYLLFLGIQRLS